MKLISFSDTQGPLTSKPNFCRRSERGCADHCAHEVVHLARRERGQTSWDVRLGDELDGHRLGQRARRLARAQSSRTAWRPSSP